MLETGLIYFDVVSRDQEQDAEIRHLIYPATKLFLLETDLVQNFILRTLAPAST